MRELPRDPARWTPRSTSRFLFAISPPGPKPAASIAPSLRGYIANRLRPPRCKRADIRDLDRRLWNRRAAARYHFRYHPRVRRRRLRAKVMRWPANRRACGARPTGFEPVTFGFVDLARYSAELVCARNLALGRHQAACDLVGVRPKPAWSVALLLPSYSDSPAASRAPLRVVCQLAPTTLPSRKIHTA